MRVSGSGSTGPVEEGEPTGASAAGASAEAAATVPARGSSGLAARAHRASGGSDAKTLEQGWSSYDANGVQQPSKLFKECSARSLPKEAHAQAEAWAKEAKNGAWYSTEADTTSAKVDGKTYYAVSIQTRDTGASLMKIYDAAGKLVASGNTDDNGDNHWGK